MFWIEIWFQNKMMLNQVGNQELNREASLSQYRFGVDFRYLNSQVKHFSYAIPDLQELTESLRKDCPLSKRYLCYYKVSV
jgi:hypothetical protein